MLPSRRCRDPDVRGSIVSSRGMTLVEILISMAVSLVVVLAVYQTLAASEGYRRTATSGGDATFDGTVALFTLQHDLRMAGFGVNSPAILGCRVLAYDGGMDPPRDLEFLLAPVNVTQGAGTAPDTLEIVFSNSDAVPAPIRLTQATPTNTADLRIDNGFGIQSGHLMVVGEPGADCTLQQATNTPMLEPAGQQDKLTRISGNYRTPIGTWAASRYNRPGGLGPNYTLAGLVFAMGAAPGVNRYYIQNGTLVVDQLLQGNVAMPVATGIVQLQAQYGRDTDGDGAVDVWDEIAPAAPNAWATIAALRVGLVARSALPERPDPATGACATTEVAPSWVAGPFALTADPNWRCYRYRVFETTVSLRNMIWRPV
jgi:type IV pilus assembly protein PilW